MTNKKNLPLFLGLLIPVLLVVFVTLSVYVPMLLMKPTYNFVYAAGGNYSYFLNYEVSENRLALSCGTQDKSAYPPGDGPPACTPENAGKLYLYDVKANTSTEISYADAQKLTLNSNTQSPDGYEVLNSSTGGGAFPFFGGSSYQTEYIKGHGGSKKLNVPTQTTYYSPYGFTFLGWIQ